MLRYMQGKALRITLRKIARQNQTIHLDPGVGSSSDVQGSNPNGGKGRQGKKRVFVNPEPTNNTMMVILTSGI